MSEVYSDPEKELVVKMNSLSVSSHELCLERCNNFQKLRLQGIQTDVTIVCSDGQLFAHRLVLRSKNAFFDSMFSLGFIEDTSSCVRFAEIDTATMELVLDFLYMQNMYTDNLTLDQQVSLMSAADFINEVPLYDVCCQSISKKIDDNNWRYILDLALLYENNGFVEKIIHFLAVSYNWSTTSTIFMDFDFGCFKKLITNFFTSIYQQNDVVLKTLMQWIMFDFENRKHFVHDLLEKFDFKTLPDTIVKRLLFTTRMDQHPSISSLFYKKASSFDFGETVFSGPRLIFEKKDMRSYFYFHISSRSEQKRSLSIRLPSLKSCAVGQNCLYFLHDKEENGVDVLNLRVFYPDVNDVQKTSCVLPFREHFGYVALGDNLYVIGGSTGSFRPYEKSYSLDLVTGNYKTIASPALHRYEPIVLELDGCLYIFGGTFSRYDKANLHILTISVVEKYCPRQDKWEMITTIPFQQDFEIVAICPCLGKIYIFLWPDDFRRRYFVYDPKTNVWTDLSEECNYVENCLLCFSSISLPFLLFLDQYDVYMFDPIIKRKCFLTKAKYIYKCPIILL